MKAKKNKFDKICMYCGTMFKRLKFRVIENEEDNFRDFCDCFCLWSYYKKVDDEEKNKEEILKKNKIYCKENIEIARKSWLQTSKRYAKNHPERVKAHTIARKIPMKFACEICGSKEKLQRHHLRYDKPLLFLTLCDYCHKVQHKQILNEVKKFQ